MSTEPTESSTPVHARGYAAIAERIYTRGLWERSVLRNSMKNTVSTPRQPIKIVDCKQMMDSVDVCKKCRLK